MAERNPQSVDTSPPDEEGTARAGRIVELEARLREVEQAAEAWRQTCHLLEIINSSNDRRELMRSLTGYLRELTGCEAVGVRLREGADYPYFVTRGFPEEFVLAEMHLCSFDSDGQVVCEADGSPVLECICGNVIKGRTDPALPFFTDYGSFWTNSTSKLLASISEAERQARTRNRCNGEGYESVALIPLRAHGETFGLVQINDGREDRFTSREIALLEQMVDYVAVALSREETRHQLDQSERAARAVMRATDDPAMLVAVDGRVLYANDALCRSLKTTMEELGGTNIFDWLAPSIARLRQRYLADVVRTGRPVRFEDSREGRVYDNSLQPVKNSEGLVEKIAVFARDITDIRRSQQALRESEQRYRDLIHWAPVSILVVQGGKYVFANPAGAARLGYSRPEDLVGRDALSTIAPACHEAVLKRMKSLNEGCPNPPMEIEILAADGTAAPVESTSIPIILDGKAASLIIGIDISERKAAETSLRDSLDEKDALLREVHHRVKNNLQVISSLLGLQANALDDPSAAKPLWETQRRVLAIADVHQQLHDTGPLARVSLGAYLAGLARQLSQTHSRPDIVEYVELDDLEADTDCAVLCGLIVNELYSNAFKHAFEPGRGGQVWLTLRATDTASCEITVADDGRGLPEKVHLDHPDTLGLQLVRILAGQLRADLEVGRDVGCRFRLRFRPHRSHRPPEASR